jgi:hypothetical protein
MNTAATPRVHYADALLTRLRAARAALSPDDRRLPSRCELLMRALDQAIAEQHEQEPKS